MPLWPLLELGASSEDALKDLYWQVYEYEYLRKHDGSYLTLHDWRGTKVEFRPQKFNHAFSRSSDYRAHGIHDLPFCMQRAARILWIRETLLGNAPMTHLRRVARPKGRDFVISQTYLVPAERFIVVLQQRTGVLFFHTAYPADRASFDRAMSEGAHIETRTP